jgi:hypothetical protein
MVPSRGELIELLGPAELTVGDEQPRARDDASDLRQQAGDQGAIVRLAIGVGLQGDRQAIP